LAAGRCCQTPFGSLLYGYPFDFLAGFEENRSFIKSPKIKDADKIWRIVSIFSVIFPFPLFSLYFSIRIRPYYSKWGRYTINLETGDYTP
jgi:hypothetical protein